MKKITKIAIALLLLSPVAVAVDYEFIRGNTSKLILVNMYGVDGSPKTGLAFGGVTATYTRNTGSADTDVTEATMTMGTWVSGGWIEVDATNSPGLYQFGIPNAAMASGAESVIFSFKATDTFQRFVHASLIDVDFRNGANVAANTVQIEGSDATNQINAEADIALADYDPPTNAEMIARTLVSAAYFDPAADVVANVTTVSTLTGHTPQTADHTANIAAILADTAAMDTASEIRALITGSDTPVATQAAQTTAQSDLDVLTGTNGVTLATSQPNYAPATVAALSAHDGKLDTVDDLLDTEIAAILADTNELQTRFANMVEVDGGDWRYTTNALEQGPTGGGGGGGGDATAANQTTILAHLTDIKGATWASTDSLEAIRNRGDAAWGGGSGSGSVAVNHDTGGADTFTVEDAGGAGIENAMVMAYVKTEYDAGVFTLRAQTTTNADGEWRTPLFLNPDIEYTLVFYKPGSFGPATDTVTPEE